MFVCLNLNKRELSRFYDLQIDQQSLVVVVSCSSRIVSFKKMALTSCFSYLKDKLYGNNGATATAKGTAPTTSAYGTFYPESTTITYSSPPVSSSNTSTTKEESYQSMPPPADQESPYSYGYGDEKRKMLTQGGDYSMYSTAYPSSVTGGQSYNNYGKFLFYFLQ